MESLKKAKQPVAQLLCIIHNTGTVHSTLAHIAMITPVAGDVVNDKVADSLSWGKSMELEDSLADPAGIITSEKAGGDKVHGVTQVH